MQDPTHQQEGESVNKDGSSSGGPVTAPTSSMWGKKGRGYPQLAKGSKDSKDSKDGKK